MSGCVYWGSENIPIMKDALGKKNIPISKVSSSEIITILWCNIKLVKLKCIIHKGYSQSPHHSKSPGVVYADCSSFSLLSYVIIYNTQHKFLPILSDATHLVPILSEIFSLIKRKCIIHKGYSQSPHHSKSPGVVYADCSSFSLLSYVIIYNTQHKFLPILSDATNLVPILSEIFSLISLP